MSDKETRKRKEMRISVLNKFDRRCAYCGCHLGAYFHIDHLVPKTKFTPFRSDDGKMVYVDDLENLMPACESCNACKSDLTLERFRDRIFDRVVRLNNNSEFKTAKRFGLVTENDIEIQFHFQKCLVDG